jgi:hypothetical protein
VVENHPGRRAPRAKLGGLSLASGRPTSSCHIAFEVSERAASIDMTYMP